MLGYERVRLGIDFALNGASTRQPINGLELSTSLVEGNFSLGYEVLRHAGFTLFVAAGFGGGNFAVDARTPGLSLFASQLAAWEKSRVTFDYSLASFELGYAHFIELGLAGDPFSARRGSARWAVQLGMRAGPSWQLGGAWYADSKEHRLQAPKLDMSGVQARLLVGFALYAVPLPRG